MNKQELEINDRNDWTDWVTKGFPKLKFGQDINSRWRFISHVPLIIENKSEGKAYRKIDKAWHMIHDDIIDE